MGQFQTETLPTDVVGSEIFSIWSSRRENRGQIPIFLILTEFDLPSSAQSTASCRRSLRGCFRVQPGECGGARRRVAFSICLAKHACPRPTRRWWRRPARRRSHFRARRENSAWVRHGLPPYRGRAPGKPGDRRPEGNLSIGEGRRNSTSHQHADAGPCGRAPDSTRHHDNTQGSRPRCRSARRGSAPPRVPRSGSRPY
jgi:hypothetical protein